MEHINIISQEAITRGLEWPPIVIGIIGILFVLYAFILLFKFRNDVDKATKHCVNLFTHAFVCIVLLVIAEGVCTLFFPVETGRYKYEGTLDPDMTIVEFEEFQQQYSNVRFEDGVWKWEDK